MEQLFDELVQPNSEFRSYCRHLLANTNKLDADDLVQSVICEIWEKRRECTYNNLMGLAVRIAQRRAADFYRDLKRPCAGPIKSASNCIEDVHHSLTDDPQNAPDNNGAIRRERWAKLSGLLNGKPKDVFLACYRDDLSNGEAADRLGISISSVSSHKSIAHEKIRNAVSSNVLEIGDFL